MMFKSLQRKFVFIATGSFLLIMLCVIGSINIVNMKIQSDKINSLIDVIIENDGFFPDMKDKPHPPDMGKKDFKMSKETPFETRYFWAKVDENDRIIQINTGHIAAVSSSDVNNYCQQVLEKNKTSGYIGIYKYKVEKKDYGTFLLFVDTARVKENELSLLFLSSSIGVITVICMFILVSFFSKHAIKPIIESNNKQKMFITDAGHEIKTPLAIISANVDVLEIEKGKSEWTKSIKNQVKRLDELVKNLLMLSKLEEAQEIKSPTEFSLNELLSLKIEEFRPIAQLNKQNIVFDIDENLLFKGDREGILHLISILIDNSVKYANQESEIKISLKKTAKAIKLSIGNRTEKMPDGDLNRLFDRFYRLDEARTQQTNKSGYGIGLSVANSIVQAHKGKIVAKSEDINMLYFTVTLPI